MTCAPPPLTPYTSLRVVWLWDGIWLVVRTVLPTVPATACDVNAVVKATDPPVLAAPLTIRNALLSWVVLFVQPVGALVCTKSMIVPDGNDGVAVTASAYTDLMLVPSLTIIVA